MLGHYINIAKHLGFIILSIIMLCVISEISFLSKYIYVLSKFLVFVILC